MVEPKAHGGRLLFLLLCFLLWQPASSQDLPYARRLVYTLSSPTFWGRGYTQDGMGQAARFLALELKSHGLKPLQGPDFFQEFTYPVNTFPGKVEVHLNGLRLEPGRDFIVSPESKGQKSAGSLVRQDSTHFVDVANRIMVSLEDKLTWSVATQVADYTEIKVRKGAVPGEPTTIRVHIDSKFVPKFKAANVAGLVKGTQYPDRYLVLTAHYDHLGGMGPDTYFPGANDNASGVALLLGLAKHYAAQPPPYSLVFLFFAGEEAGLLGSKYFTDRPLVDLSKIRFLVNVDLAGTGEEGITVVNATLHPTEFKLLQEINAQEKYLTQIKSRGKAANSDHYWFSEKGVPAFFVYTLGGIKAYQDIHDQASTLPLAEFGDLTRLLKQFLKRMME